MNLYQPHSTETKQLLYKALTTYKLALQQTHDQLMALQPTEKFTADQQAQVLATIATEMIEVDVQRDRVYAATPVDHMDSSKALAIVTGAPNAFV